MRRPRSKSIYALIAGALLALLVMPIALAGAAGDHQAKSSSSVKKQVKKLKRQVNQLQQQLEDVSKQPGPQGPEGAPGAQGPPGPSTGPAGGDLTGRYPDPLIGPAAVGSAEIASDAVTNGKIADEAVNGSDIVDQGVSQLDLAPNSVGSGELLTDSVGSSELKGLTPAASAGVTVSPGQVRDIEVTCPAGKMAIGGGYAWRFFTESQVIASAPSETDPNRTWVVRGIVPTGAPANDLFGWANCLDV